MHWTQRKCLTPYFHPSTHDVQCIESTLAIRLGVLRSEDLVSWIDHPCLFFDKIRLINEVKAYSWSWILFLDTAKSVRFILVHAFWCKQELIIWEWLFFMHFLDGTWRFFLIKQTPRVIQRFLCSYGPCTDIVSASLLKSLREQNSI